MIKVLFALFFISVSFVSMAQCRQWFGEPVDSIKGIIAMIQKDVPTPLIFDSVNSSIGHGLHYIYRDTLDHLSTDRNASISVSLRFESHDSLVGTKYVTVCDGLRSLTIKAPYEWLNKIRETFRNTISSCIVGEGQLYTSFGTNKDNPDRILLNNGQLDLVLQSGLKIERIGL